MTQRFGRRAVYVVVGDGVEEETVAKKVSQRLRTKLNKKQQQKSMSIL